MTRSASNAYEVTNYTGLINKIPVKWSFMDELFTETDGVNTTSFEVELKDGTLGLVKDAARGRRRQVNGSDKAVLKSFPMPFFPFDDAVTAADVQNKRMVGTADMEETVGNVVAMKLARARDSWNQTREYARWKAIYGSVYAPNGSVDVNWYRDLLGAGTAPSHVAIDVSNSSTNVVGGLLTLEDAIQDSIKTGSQADRIIVWCSTGWFDDFIQHPDVVEAYKYYESGIQPLRQLQGDRTFKSFEFQNFEFVRVRGSIGGNALVTANECIATPVLSDMYMTVYGPEDSLDGANQPGQEMYAREVRAPNGREITLEMESTFLNIVKRPEAIRRITLS
jgi:hypothetical protein